MPTTYRELRDRVAAYMHRDAAVFLMNGQDLLLQAVNDAKNFAQRAVDFEFSRTFASMPGVNTRTGASFAQGMLIYGTNETVLVKAIKRVFIEDSAGGIPIPIDFISRDSYVDRLKRRYENVGMASEISQRSSPIDSFPLSAMQVGQHIYIAPANAGGNGVSEVNLHFDIFRWLPDFVATGLLGTASSTSTGNLVDSTKNFLQLGVRVGDQVLNTTDGTYASVVAITSATTLVLSADIFTIGEGYNIGVVSPTQTNFLLDYCFDFMLFRSIYTLNFYLKEDERVAISDRVMKEVWDNVIRWNGSIIGNSTDDANLS